MSKGDSSGPVFLPEAVAILRHALGLAQHKRAYRNHFVTGPGSSDYDTCMELVSRGLMRQHPASALTGGDPWFQVTDDGRKLAEAA